MTFAGESKVLPRMWQKGFESVEGFLYLDSKNEENALLCLGKAVFEGIEVFSTNASKGVIII